MKFKTIIASLLGLTLVLGMTLSQAGLVSITQTGQDSVSSPPISTTVGPNNEGKAIVFSENTVGDVSVESLWEFEIWDGESGFEVINTTGVAGLIASEGDNVTKITPVLNSGWWGGGLLVDTGVDVSVYGGSIVFDIKTEYATSFEIGFQTSDGATTSDHRYEVVNGQDYNNDSSWHTVVLPISSFNGGTPDLSNVTFVLMFNQGAVLDDAPIYLDNIYWSAYALTVADKAVVFSETTVGDVSVESLWKFDIWDGESGFEVINTTGVTGLTASEGDNVTKITPVLNSGWWGGGLVVDTGVDVSAYDGSIVFDILTNYSTSFEIGFQTSNGTISSDYRYEVVNGQDYNNDSTWQNVMIPINSFSGGQPDLSNVTFVLMFNQGAVLDDAPIYLDNIYWSSYVPTGDKVASVFSETTEADASVDSLWEFNIWDGESGFEVINTTGVEGLTAPEGDNVTKITPVLNSGWWGGGLVVDTGVNVSMFDGYIVFDINTAYATSFEVGFQTSFENGTTNDHRYELVNGQDYTNDSVWQTVHLPLNYFSGGAQYLDNVTFVIMFNQGSILDDAPIYLDNILWISSATATPAPADVPEPPREATYTFDGTADAVIYSETVVGADVPGNFIQWNPTSSQQTLEKVTDVVSEGSEAYRLESFGIDFQPFWGTGFSEGENIYDLSAFENGYLIFDMKSTYDNIFEVGFQENIFPDNVNGFMSLNAGEYGYDNDNQWRTVVIPMADIKAAAPDANLGLTNAAFVLFDDDVSNDGIVGAGVIYFDNVRYVADDTNLPTAGLIDDLVETSTSTTSTTTTTSEDTSQTEDDDSDAGFLPVSIAGILTAFVAIPLLRRYMTK